MKLSHVKDIRKSLSLSQGDTAKAMGLSKLTYIKLENGTSEMTLQRAVRLYEFFAAYTPTSTRLYNAMKWLLETIMQEGFKRDEDHVAVINDWIRRYESHQKRIQDEKDCPAKLQRRLNNFDLRLQ